MTLPITDQQKIADFLKDRHIPSGLGNKEEACSIAAINLALYNELTDDIPDCMSQVIGNWIIKVQDSMPDEMRNSDGWRNLLPFAAGTGRDKEKERLNIILNWMWEKVLPTLQPIADKHGFGSQWQEMLRCKTSEAAYAAYAAARATAANANATAYAAYATAYAAYATTTAAYATTTAANAAATAAIGAARAAASTTTEAARTAAATEAARTAAATEAARTAAWATLDPVGLLRELVK